jgi:hypothetical protein
MLALRTNTIVLALFVSLAGCLRDGPPAASPNSVVFALAPVDATTPVRVGWLATYETEGKTARFRIELEAEPRGASLPAFVRCGLHREPDSDASVLLRDVARALGRRVPSPEPGVATLDVAAVLLGRDLSRGGGGSVVAGTFGSEPKGNWISTKLFLGDGEGEVFLNLDPIGGYGELSMKDPDYSDAVVRELARLLQGEVSAAAAKREIPDPIDVAPEPSKAPAPEPDRDATRIAALVEQAGKGVRQPERRRALESLAKMGPRAREAVPVFLVALEDEDVIIRGEALRGLPKLRPDPQVGASAVRPLLNDSYPANQVWAANALAEFGETQTAATYLTVFLKGEQKQGAAAGLARLGPEARGAVPHLVAMLESRAGPNDGYWAAMALAAIGRDAKSALPALEAASRDPSKTVSDAANFAIREIAGRELPSEGSRDKSNR